MIDDYSRKLWIYFLKTKNEAFNKFVEWKTLIENQTGNKIKRLRTDNGLEFCNQEFDNYCAKSGISRHRTCTYTPQQNGVAERMNRTIMDKVRCMLAESGMPNVFWAEAASTACYLINRSPSSAIDFLVPDFKWSNVKPGYNHLRIFGCIAYVHVSQGKLNPRAKKGVFLGYPNGVKGYKVWLLDDLKCVISRDVTFNENVFYKTNTTTSDLASSKQAEQIDQFQGKLQQMNDSSQTETEESQNEGEVPQDQSGNFYDIDQSHEMTDPLMNDKIVPNEKDPHNDADKNQQLDGYILSRDRMKRQIRPPPRFANVDFIAFALNIADMLELEETCNYIEARMSKAWPQWKKAMDEELESLHKNNTWTLIDRPQRERVIGSKWVFKLKHGIPGVEAPRFKARLVAKGFSQVEGVDYHDVFSPVVKHTSIRILLAITAIQNLELEQLDVKTAFFMEILTKGF